LAAPLARLRTFECARSRARRRLGLTASAELAGICRYTLPCRARRGTSGALYLQSAPAGLNSLPRSPSSEAAAPGDVEDRVPRSGDSRTVSGPEGSSTQRISSSAADRPGPSRLSRWARVRDGRRGVHGTFTDCPRPAGNPGAP